MRLAPDMSRPARPWAALLLLGLVALITFLPLLSMWVGPLNRFCSTALCWSAPQMVVPFTVSKAVRGPIISPWLPIGYWLLGIAGFGWVLRRAPWRLILLSSLAMLLVWTALAQGLIALAGWHFFYDGI